MSADERSLDVDEVDAVVRVHGRPAPEYGEYAPPGWVSPVEAQAETEGPQELAHPAPGPADPAAPSLDAPPPTGAPVPGPPPVALRRAAGNRAATLVLIAYGLFRVITDAIDSAGFASAFEAQFRQMGFLSGTFQSSEALQAVGIVSAFVSIPLFLITVVIALRRLRSGRRSWLVLLLTGAIVNVITGIVVVVVVMSDPSYTPTL